MDSFGSRAREERIAFRDDDCAWVPDAVVDQPAGQGCDSSGRRGAADDQLRIESRALSCAGARRLEDSRALHFAELSGSCRNAGSSLYVLRGMRGKHQAVLCGGVDYTVLPMNCPHGPLGRRFAICIATDGAIPSRWSAIRETKSTPYHRISSKRTSGPAVTSG